MKHMYRWLAVGIVALLAGALALGAVACSDDDEGGDEGPTATEGAEPTGEDTPEPSAGGELEIRTLEYQFQAPASISGGLTHITLNNVGGEDHQALLFLLNEGVTLQDFSAALQADETGAQALAMSTGAGGPNVVAPQGSSEVYVDLEPGVYAMICFVSSADGTPHAAQGMLSQLDVTEPAEEAEAPETDGSVLLQDFEFEAPATMPSGEVTLQVANNGPQPHEMGVLKLDEGFTIDDLVASLQSEEEPTGPPPVTSAGGLGVIPAGAEGFAVLNLEAGTYALLCFVPDTETGQPHAALGMVGSFTVEE